MVSNSALNCDKNVSKLDLEELQALFPSDMRKYNVPGKRKKNVLTAHFSVLLTPQQKRGIDILIDSGKFADQSEFIRYLIIKYFDEV